MGLSYEMPVLRVRKRLRLLRFVIYVGTTWAAYEYLDSKIHLGRLFAKLLSKLF
jgi:hypothetical protein